MARIGKARTLLHVSTDWPGNFPNSAATKTIGVERTTLYDRALDSVWPAVLNGLADLPGATTGARFGSSIRGPTSPRTSHRGIIPNTYAAFRSIGAAPICFGSAAEITR